MVEKKLYKQLVKRIRDAEVAHRKDDPADEELLAAGLEIRLCPQCKTRLEKNEGCPCVQSCSIVWVAGHVFRVRQLTAPNVLV